MYSYLPINYIALFPGVAASARGPSGAPMLIHNPALDWDKDFDGNGTPDLKHEYKFDLEMWHTHSGQFDSIVEWQLVVDWNRDGTFACSGCPAPNYQCTDECVSLKRNMSYSVAESLPIHDTLQNPGIYTDSGNSHKYAPLTIWKALPSQATPSSVGAYAYELKATYHVADPINGDYTLGPKTNYGAIHIPTMSTWSSVYGPNWVSSFDRHLEFATCAFPGCPNPGGLNFDGGGNKNTMIWVDNQRAIAFPMGTGTGGNAAIGDAPMYLFTAKTKDFGQGNENLWELLTYGSGDLEYYYRENAGTNLRGKLRALVDRFGNTTLFTYYSSGQVAGYPATATDATGAVWTWTYPDFPNTVNVTYAPISGSTDTQTAVIRRDSYGRVSSWSSALDGSNHTQDFTYGTVNTFNQNRIATKTGLGQPQTTYTYSTDSFAKDIGYLIKADKTDGSTTLRSTIAYEWAQTFGSGAEWKSQRRVVFKDERDIQDGRVGQKYYLMNNGRIWRHLTTATSEISSDRLATDVEYYSSSIYKQFEPVQNIQKKWDGSAWSPIHYVTKIYRTVLANGGTWAGKGSLPATVYAPDDRARSYSYDENTTCGGGGALLASVSSGGHTTTYNYGCVGSSRVLTQVVDPASNSTVYGYNSYGQITSLTLPGQTENKTWAYYTTSTSCSPTGGNLNGRLSIVKDQEANAGAGGTTTEYKYDCPGRSVSVANLNNTSAITRQTLYAYDADGSLTKVTEKGTISPDADISTTYYYDPGRRLTKGVDAKGDNRYRFDGFGRLTAEQRTDAGANSTTYYSYAYDSKGMLTAVTDANSSTLYRDYDVRGRLTQNRNGTGSFTETYERTIDSRPTHVAYTNSMTPYSPAFSSDTWYTYDYTWGDEYSGATYKDSSGVNGATPSGRLIAITSKLLAVSTNPYRHVVYRFDPTTSNDDLLTMVEIFGDDDSGWADRDATEVGSTPANENFTREYKYTVRNEVSKLTATFPGLKTEDVTFAYNGNGTSSVVCNGTNCATPTGWKTSYDYYKNQWAKSIAHTLSGVTLPELTYGGDITGYDFDGNLLHSSEILGGPYTVNDYWYDSFNRLTKYDTGVSVDDNFSYSYDSAGNRLTRIKYPKAGGSSTTSYLYDYKNQLTSSSVAGGNTSYYCYDSNGNLTSQAESTACGTQSQLFTWDLRNRLAKDDGLSSGGPYKNVGYDPGGQRVFETDGDSLWYYVWDRGNPIAKYKYNLTSQGADPQEYVLYGQGLDTAISKWDTSGLGTRYDYLKDRLNSPARVLNGSTVSATYRYEPYGAQAPSSSPQPYLDRIAYTSREYCEVESSKLLYYRARWYDPEIGRFMSRDPWEGSLESPQTMNRYAYVGGNPVRFNDPGGLTRVPPDDSKPCDTRYPDSWCQKQCEKCKAKRTKCRDTCLNCPVEKDYATECDRRLFRSCCLEDHYCKAGEGYPEAVKDNGNGNTVWSCQATPPDREPCPK
ncbi:MAG: RHS repeat-associated core domain-containing protein [Candidatus Rokubacteria bacterium]|nr:RHS repeat-associated core domain-containing protein [Candidatus Rokubacteria bacterium]